LTIFSYIIPKNKKIIVIGSKGGVKFFGNPKFFYLYLVKKQDYFRPIWITQNQKIFSELKEKKLPVVMKYSLKGITSILRANYLMISHGVSDVSFLEFLPGRFKKIQSWHGTPLKVIGYKHSSQTLFGSKKAFRFIHKSESKSYHTILSPSEEIKKILENVFENNNVFNLGYPRNDVFYDREINYENYSENFQLEKYSKKILFCPTFREAENPKIAFSENFLKKFDQYLRDANQIFIIKGHINEKNKISTKDYSNIIDVSEDVEDIQGLLLNIDILITDYSSVFFDFVLLERPIIFYSYDYDEYVKNQSLFFDYFEDLPGPFVKNEEELFEEIKNIESSFQNIEYKNKFNKFNKRFNFYQDGGSCKRLLSHLIKK
jgi:CDP-glycerol glycerophosphotransferase (TagB/SpsB family)